MGRKTFNVELLSRLFPEFMANLEESENGKGLGVMQAAFPLRQFLHSSCPLREVDFSEFSSLDEQQFTAFLKVRYFKCLLLFSHI